MLLQMRRDSRLSSEALPHVRLRNGGGVGVGGRKGAGEGSGRLRRELPMS